MVEVAAEGLTPEASDPSGAPLPPSEKFLLETDEES